MNKMNFKAWYEAEQLMLSVGTVHFKLRLLTGFANGRKYNLGFDDVIFCQSTGVKDKNGKEIFVGDILKGTCLTVEVVIGWNGGFYGREDGANFCYIANIAASSEIIGNKYENKDQIK